MFLNHSYLNFLTIGATFPVEQCDQMARLCFQFWPFTAMRFYQIPQLLVKVGTTFLPKTKWALNKLPKFFEISPKWQKSPNLVTLLTKLIFTLPNLHCFCKGISPSGDICMKPRRSNFSKITFPYWYSFVQNHTQRYVQFRYTRKYIFTRRYNENIFGPTYGY